MLCAFSGIKSWRETGCSYRREQAGRAVAGLGWAGLRCALGWCGPVPGLVPAVCFTLIGAACTPSNVGDGAVEVGGGSSALNERCTPCPDTSAPPLRCNQRIDSVTTKDLVHCGLRTVAVSSQWPACPRLGCTVLNRTARTRMRPALFALQVDTPHWRRSLFQFPATEKHKPRNWGNSTQKPRVKNNNF